MALMMSQGVYQFLLVHFAAPPDANLAGLFAKLLAATLFVF